MFAITKHCYRSGKSYLVEEQQEEVATGVSCYLPFLWKASTKIAFSLSLSWLSAYKKRVDIRWQKGTAVLHIAKRVFVIISGVHCIVFNNLWYLLCCSYSDSSVREKKGLDSTLSVAASLLQSTIKTYHFQAFHTNFLDWLKAELYDFDVAILEWRNPLLRLIKDNPKSRYAQLNVFSHGIPYTETVVDSDPLKQSQDSIQDSTGG